MFLLRPCFYRDRRRNVLRDIDDIAAIRAALKLMQKMPPLIFINIIYVYI